MAIGTRITPAQKFLARIPTISKITAVTAFRWKYQKRFSVIIDSWYEYLDSTEVIQENKLNFEDQLAKVPQFNYELSLWNRI